MHDTQPIILGVFLPVLMICVFSFISIAVWADARRREREAFYRSETMKKLAESAGTGGATVLEMMREQDRSARRRRREGQKLGGLVVTAIGVGLMAFLRGIDQKQPAYLMGLIPLLVGLSVLAFGLIAEKE